MLIDVRFERRQRDALRVGGAIASLGESTGALGDELPEPRRRRNMVDEPPGLRPIGAYTFGGRAEHIGEIAPDLALVDEPGQPTGTGQHAEQRDFRQADRARPVVDHNDLVAGESQLVAATGAGAVDRRDEFELRMGARILDAVARLVGEFAEIDFLCMARLAQHVDVGAGAEHALSAARQDHDAHFRMLESDAVQRIV